MRKGQQKIIEKAKQINLPQSMIQVLYDEGYPVTMYSVLIQFFQRCLVRKIPEYDTEEQMGWRSFVYIDNNNLTSKQRYCSCSELFFVQSISTEDKRNLFHELEKIYDHDNLYYLNFFLNAYLCCEKIFFNSQDFLSELKRCIIKTKDEYQVDKTYCELFSILLFKIKESYDKKYSNTNHVELDFRLIRSIMNYLYSDLLNSNTDRYSYYSSLNEQSWLIDKIVTGNANDDMEHLVLNEQKDYDFLKEKVVQYFSIHGEEFEKNNEFIKDSFKSEPGKWGYYEWTDDVIKNANIAKTMSCSCELKVNSIYSNTFINSSQIIFKFYKISKLYVDGDQQNRVGCYSSKYCELIYSKGYGFYQELKTKTGTKLIPLSVKRLSILKNTLILKNSKYFDFICSVFFELLATKTLFANDVYHIFQQEIFRIPLLLNDIPKYVNFQQAYGNAYPVGRNWNKSSPNLLYIIYNASRYIDEKSKQILQQYQGNLHNKMLPTASFCGKGSKAWNEIFLSEFIKNNIQESMKKELSRDDSIIIEDYVRLCVMSGEKINLRKKSISKIRQIHNEQIVRQKMKKCQNIRIPEKSSFLKLQKMLPENFILIDSKMKICQEAILQHNCVTSYVDYINKDVCVIYALDYKGVHYTIEFRYDKINSKYLIWQMKGPCNSECTQEVYEYVETFLK
jgi:hypothetical protein